MQKILPYILDTITKYKVRHEVHSFDSGAYMIDIWIGNNFFYVIQLHDNIIDISLNPAFNSTPDHTFKNEVSFKNFFEKIIIDNNPLDPASINNENR